MRFAVVELASGIVEKTGRYSRLREEVENAEPERWYNPVLVVLPKGFKRTGEEGEIDQLEPLEDWVVAVPGSGWGYGAEYIGVVNRNRRKFGLPGYFEPSEEMTDVVGFRQKLSGIPLEEAVPLIALSEEALSEPGKRSEEYKRLKKLLEAKEAKELEETPKWARRILEEKREDVEE